MKKSTPQLQEPGSPTRSRVRLLPLAAAVIVASLLAAACSVGSDGIDVAAVDPIETNGGNVLVKPPDVLEGNPEPTPTPSVTEPAADPQAQTEVAFEYADGSAGSTADFIGQPTVLNFWASNCPACVREMPEFEEVSQALLGEVAFVGMNVNDTSREAADRLAIETGVTYPLAFDTNSQVFASVRGFVMPTTVFFDETGAVVFSWSGVLTGDELMNLIVEHIAPGVASDV